MTVTAPDRLFYAYVADGLATERSIGFPLRRSADLVVAADGVPQVLGQHYIIVGSAVTDQRIKPLAPFWPSGAVIAYWRHTARVQEYDVPAGVDIRNESLEDELDRMAFQQQEQDAELARAFKVPLGEVGPSLPPAASRAGRIFAFDGTGASLLDITADEVRQAVASVFNPQFVQFASLVMFLAPGPGTEARPVQEKLGEFPSITDYISVAAADAAPGAKYVPTGIHNTTLTSAQIEGVYFGDGQIRDAGGNLRAPNFSQRRTAPASIGNWDSIETAYGGDLSTMQRVSEHRVEGTGTLGIPTTGYTLWREAGATFDYMYVGPQAGHNQQLATNVGRTGAVGWGRQVFHAGNGDAFVHWGSGIATGTKAGSTHFLANPAIVLYGGQLFAAANGVYMQLLGDLNADDLGYDAALQAMTFNGYRSNKVGAKDADWTVLRLQNQGSEGMNAWFAAAGQADIGIDMSASVFGALKGAIALPSGARIYFDASNGNPESLSRFTNLGNAFIEHSAGADAIVIGNGGASVCQFAEDRITANVGTRQVPRTASALPAAAGNPGLRFTVSDANSTTRRAVLVGGGSETVEVMSIGGQWLIL